MDHYSTCICLWNAAVVGHVWRYSVLPTANYWHFHQYTTRITEERQQLKVCFFTTHFLLSAVSLNNSNKYDYQLKMHFQSVMSASLLY